MSLESVQHQAPCPGLYMPRKRDNTLTRAVAQCLVERQDKYSIIKGTGAYDWQSNFHLINNIIGKNYA